MTPKPRPAKHNATRLILRSFTSASIGLISFSTMTPRWIEDAASLMGIPGHEDQMLNYQADTAFYGGQLAKAREFTRRAVESAQKAGEKEACSLYQAESALREALVGNADLAKAQAHAALGLSTSRDVQALSAVALAVAGESTQADRLAERSCEAFSGRHDCALPLSTCDPGRYWASKR